MGGRNRRLIAAAATWFIAGLSFAELARGIVAVGEIGGYCRSGGAVVSAIACPEGAAPRILLAAVGLAVAVIGNIALASGTGPDLPAVVLPGVFAVLAVLFLLGAFAPFRVTFLVAGLAFTVVFAVVLWLNRESGWMRVAIGSRTVDGAAIAYRTRALYHRSVPFPGEVRPHAAQVAGLAAVGWVPLVAGLGTGLVL